MRTLRRVMIHHCAAILCWSIMIVSAVAVPCRAVAGEFPLPPQFIEQSGAGSPTDLRRPMADEVIYDVIVDRFSNGDRTNDSGGISGGPSKDGFYPQHMEFFHGGDFAGLTEKLSYLEGLGITAIRLSPIMTVKPVQGDSGKEQGGYRGRWVVDFTQPDPHYGSSRELKALIDSAHKRGIKIHLTAIVNGTADLIGYRQCHDPQYTQAAAGAECAYRSIARYPFVTRGGLNGAPINRGFEGIEASERTVTNFARLNDPDFAFTPYLPEASGSSDASDTSGAVLAPVWLNDLRLFNNRGNAGDSPESRIHGDSNGQDDLMLAHPRVQRGLVDIYKTWIDTYRFDGLHIADVDAVDNVFLQAFSSAIESHALSVGIENFAVSASPRLSQPGPQAAYRQKTGIGSLTDSALSELAFQVIVGTSDVSKFREFFAQDILYSGHASQSDDASGLPVALSTVDTGRLTGRLRADVSPDENRLLEDFQLAYAIAFFLRGVPVIYYGDEQGFASDAHGPSAEEDMLESRVESYIDNDLLGSNQTPGVANFDRRHPLYRAISAMAKIRSQHEALRTGSQELLVARDGILIVSRIGQSGDHYLIGYNFGSQNQTVQLDVDSRLRRFSGIVGRCQPTPTVSGSYRLDIPDREVVICMGNAG